jgi:hypothetical protein
VRRHHDRGVGRQRRHRRPPPRLLATLQHGLRHRSSNLTIRTAILDATISQEIRDRLATPEKLEEAAGIVREELAAALKDIPGREVHAQKAPRVARTEVANFVRAIASGVNARSVSDALTAAEATRDQLGAQLEKLQSAPRPSDIAIHPTAVQELIGDVTRALNQDVAVCREALRQYLGPTTMRPAVEDGEPGARFYVAEGTFDATVALGGPGLWPGPPMCRW